MGFPERMNVAQMTERDLTLLPSSVAAGLQHLDGLVFFDSSGNFPDGVEEVISIVAARPSQILRGNVSDVSSIEEVLGGLCD